MPYLIVILFLAVVFAAALLIWTALKRSHCRRLEGEHPSFSPEELAVYGQTLQKMLQCKTVSVKGSYDDAEFKKLRDTVEESFSLLNQKDQRQIFSQDCWIYKIPGKDPTRNIMLMSHHDVVEAREGWTRDAFLGQIEEGKIYGRGAADTKGSLCAILFAAEQLFAKGFQPEVNVYIGSSHNEELCGDSIPSSQEYFQKQGICFEVILDEGGAIVDPPLGNMKCEKCAMVAVHEKGRFKVTCTATWESSHVSRTGYKNNPVDGWLASFRKSLRKVPLSQS